MPPIRVFIADDSPVDRRLIERLLEREPGIEVVGLSADGTEALEAAANGAVDALVLDLEMPGLGGMDTLRQLKSVAAGLRVIVFTGSKDALTEEKATEAYGSRVDALAKNEGSAREIEIIGKRLIPLLVAEPRPARRSRAKEMPPSTPPSTSMALLPVRAKPTPPAAAIRETTRDKLPEAPRDKKRAPGATVSLLVIGASTGGPNALTQVLSELPEDLEVPVLVTQHMPEGFTAAFADRLDRASKLKVLEAAGGEALLPGTVWLAPGGRHLEVASDGPRLVTILTDAPPENSCRPAVDPLFRSAAAAIGARTLAVVLTGMGKDGLVGAGIVRESGGLVIVQDEESSVVWGMPGAVAQAGLADHIRPLGEIGALIVTTVASGRSRRKGA